MCRTDSGATPRNAAASSRDIRLGSAIGALGLSSHALSVPQRYDVTPPDDKQRVSGSQSQRMGSRTVLLIRSWRLLPRGTGEQPMGETQEICEVSVVVPSTGVF